MSLLLAWALLSSPAEDPAPTVWAESGGRPWTTCRERERQADNVLQRLSTRSDESGADTEWAAAARECPNAPSLLVLAALRSLLKPVPYPASLDLVDSVPRLAAEHREHRLQARRWLRRAQVESARRGEPAPTMTHYFLAYTALGLAEPEVARAELTEAVRRGEIESWRADRTFALAALMLGDLPGALELAYRGRELAPTSERTTSVFILALIYDRAGAPEAALREMTALRSQSGERTAVDTLLPLHERLYLDALDQQAKRNVGNAMRYWEAYLACPEPEAPERALAERRLAELRPRGSVVPMVQPEGTRGREPAPSL